MIVDLSQVKCLVDLCACVQPMESCGSIDCAETAFGGNHVDLRPVSGEFRPNNTVDGRRRKATQLTWVSGF